MTRVTHLENSAETLDELHQLARFLVEEKSIQNPAKLIQIARSHGLGALYLYKVKKADLVLSKSEEEILTSDAKSSMALYLLQQWAMLDINQALSNAGIRCI